MPQDPLQVLQAASRRPPAPGAKPRLVIAGATGVLGNEVLGRLAGAGDFAAIEVLVREPMTAGLRDLRAFVVPADAPPADWPLAAADIGVVLFEPPRAFNERERALWAPAPEALPALAQWMRASGVHTLAVVLPHAPGRLPEAVKRGLANLDEHALSALGFERLLILRTAREEARARHTNPLTRLAQAMLGIFKYMIPASEQPVRPARIAEFLAEALQVAPPGIHVAPPELLWEAAKGSSRDAARAWLG